MNNQKFVHLHCHDEYSVLDGFGKPEYYAKRAKEIGFEYLAITNHGNVDGLIKFQTACKENDIKPIFGCEAYIVEDHDNKEKGEKRKHITILVKNEKGWTNLLKMLTVSYLDGFYYKPRISPKLLLKHLDGLVIMTACASSFITTEWGMKLFKTLAKKIPNDLFIELMPFNFLDQMEVNTRGLGLSIKYNIKLVATNDCHYISSDDEQAQEVLLAIQTKKKWKDPKRWKFGVGGLYLKDADEMVEAFEDQGQLPKEIYIKAIKNTVAVAKLCGEFELKELPVDLPAVPGLEDEDDDKILKDLCKKGLRRKIFSKEKKKKKKKIYLERMNEELGLIIRQGFSRYFLIVWELVKWCKENDIMVGPGRGSVGGSLVAFCLNITAIDPIEYDLIFARFISPARIDLPDIDLDFEDSKRPLIRKHLEEMYGKWNVCGVSTFSSMKGRGAVRDVSRVFDISLVDVDKASKAIVTRSGGDFRSDYSIEDAFNTFEDGKRFKKKYPKVTKIAMKVEGQVRGKGQHAAAIVISRDDLRDGKRMSFAFGKDKDVIANWDKHDIEHQGLMKLDILGLNNLTILNETRKLVIKNHGVDIDFEEIEFDDKKVFDEFSKGNTIGIFQFGSLGLRRLCQELIIDDFQILTHATSLHRPGTLRSGMTHEFVARKRGTTKWEYKHPILKELTKNTLGIILYQEQVMWFMYELGGLGWKTADTIRKVISKSQGVEQFNKFKKDFVAGCEKKGTLDKRTAGELWDELSSFGSYGFNLSHACEYSMISYWDMYCKVHYPNEYLCACLTYGADEKKTELVEDAFRMGLDVRTPKVGKSDIYKWIVDKDILYAPFMEIKGVGEKTAPKLLALVPDSGSKKKFYRKKKKETKVGNRFLNILNSLKAFDNEPMTDAHAECVKEYFSFSFCKDPSKKFKGILEKIGMSFKVIKELDINKPYKDDEFYFGQMTEIRFGYRKNVQSASASKRQEAAGISNNLGGVYGNFKDESDFMMLVFGGKLYNDKKDLVEHCGGDFLIAKANKPSKNSNIMANDAWFEQELLSGDLDGLGLSLKKQKRYRDKSLIDCTCCDLHNECTSQVLPSPGKYNIMIVGEAPGRDEDRAGKGFVGKSGKLVWNEIERQGYRRKDFTVTSIVKCHPSKSKTPNKKQIVACSRWIDEEIRKINPFLILSFGNTGLNYFLDEKSGIMQKNGTTQWNDKANAWICWCINPASVSYHEENLPLFKEGIKNFTDKIKILGGKN